MRARARECDQTKKEKKYFVNSLANLECDKRKIKHKWTKEREERERRTLIRKTERGEEIVECFALNFTFFRLVFFSVSSFSIKWSSSTTHTQTHITVLFRNRNKEKLANSLQYL